MQHPERVVSSATVYATERSTQEHPAVLSQSTDSSRGRIFVSWRPVRLSGRGETSSHRSCRTGSGPLSVTRRRTPAVAAINDAFIAAGEQVPLEVNSAPSCNFESVVPWCRQGWIPKEQLFCREARAGRADSTSTLPLDRQDRRHERLSAGRIRTNGHDSNVLLSRLCQSGLHCVQAICN